uniref:F-box domain-containing protein n=1 Tax=Oryza barthii TaxID=65489 RepID=A0A0D3HA36_9ORYZ
MADSEALTPPRPGKRPRHADPVMLPDDVVVDHILARVPAAAVVRLRAVCRAWRAALTSDHFEYELWTWSSPSWSRRCRISLASLERPMRGELGLGGLRLLPLCTSPADGRILLATSRHKVYAYDAGSNRVDTVRRMHELVDVPAEPALMLNIALHEESVAVVVGGGDVGRRRRLKMEVGKSGEVVGKREGRLERHPSDVKPDAFEMMKRMIGLAQMMFHN